MPPGTRYHAAPTSFRSPTTLDEALADLSVLGERATLLAGGTDVMIQQMRGEVRPETLLHLGRLGELGGIHAGDPMRIGAITTHRAIATNAEIRAVFPALAEASATVGGWQTQEVGTIGGNVCNASPAADTLPPLLLAEAVVHLASRAGTRAVPVDAFILDRRRVDRRPDELVTHLTLPVPPPRSGETYLKVGPRSAMEVAVVGLAVRVTLAGDGVTVEDVRIAAGAVAPVPFLARDAEELLTGSRLDDATIDEASRRLVARAAPIDDARSSASYRRRVLGSLLPRALDEAARRAAEAVRP